MARTVWLAMVFGAFVTVLGCGDGSAPPVTGSMHPDTGVGAGETPPPSIDCLDLCLRSAYCVGQLCDEDKMSTVYVTIGDEIAAQCNVSCAAAPPIGLTMSQWQCLFQSSCRQVFERDTCGIQGTYSCT
jgi:hypothetical protein